MEEKNRFEGKREKKLYEVTLGNLSLRLLSYHDEKMVNELVLLLNQKINKVLSQKKDINFQSALFLVSLNMVEELFFMKKKAFHLLNHIEEEAQSVLTNLKISSGHQKA